MDLRHATLVTSLRVDLIRERLVKDHARVVLPQRLAVLHAGFLNLFPEQLTRKSWILGLEVVEAIMGERLAILVPDVNASVEAKRHQSGCTRCSLFMDLQMDGADALLVLSFLWRHERFPAMYLNPRIPLG